MSRSLGFNRRQEPLGEIPQTPSAESGNATMEDVTQGAGNQAARASQAPAGYERTEAGVIPEDWSASTVGAEFRVQLGKMLDAANNAGVSKPYIGNRSVQWGRIDLTGIETVALTSADLHRFRLRSGDLLVCEGGEIGRAAIWDAPIRECYFQKALHRLRPTRGYDAYLMMSMLQRWASIGHLADYVTQTSIAHLPKDKFETVPLPVPPAAEQHAIAAVLSDVDALIGSLEALIAKKRAIKRAAMQQLLTGRTRLPGFDGEWEVRRLGELGAFRKGKGIRRTELRDTGFPCVRYGELYTRYENYVIHPVSRIPTDVAATALRIERGELLLAGSGETAEEIGICVAYIGEEPAYAGGDIIVLRMSGEDPVYLAHLLNAPVAARQKARMAQGDAVVHIRSDHLAEVEFPLPPLSEQRAIAAVFTDMDDEIDALERRLDKTRAIKQGMMQQLLTGAVRLPIPDDGLEGESHDA